MRDALAVALGVVLGMGAGAVTVAYIAPRVFDWIIRRNI